MRGRSASLSSLSLITSRRRLGHGIDAGAHLWPFGPEQEAPLHEGFADVAAAHQRVELKIGERFEQYPARAGNAQAGGKNIVLQRIEGVHTAVAVLPVGFR